MKQMKPLLLILSSLILLAFTAATHAGVTDPQKELVKRVFPFEVGQQYQFKSSGPFILFDPYYSGPGSPAISLPADSVAEITITDTLIFGERFLHIPYWNPFGEGYYRYDAERKAIVQTYTNHSQLWESVIVDLRLVDYTTPHYPLVRGLNHWAYPKELTAVIPIIDFYIETPLKTGVVTIEGQNVVRMKAYAWWSSGMDWGADVYFGLGGPGWCQHGAHRDSNPYSVAVWSLFRVKSDDPWPEFDPVLGPLALGVEDREVRPEAASINIRAYPNPFNPIVTIACEIPETRDGSIRVYNLAGQLVRTLVDGLQDVGQHSITWDGRDKHGRSVASGVYLYRLVVGERSVTRRMTLMR
jgi:hypothetical protein